MVGLDVPESLAADEVAQKRLLEALGRLLRANTRAMEVFGRELDRVTRERDQARAESATVAALTEELRELKIATAVQVMDFHKRLSAIEAWRARDEKLTRQVLATIAGAP